jgi:hypothetical protein
MFFTLASWAGVVGKICLNPEANSNCSAVWGWGTWGLKEALPLAQPIMANPKITRNPAIRYDFGLAEGVERFMVFSFNGMDEYVMGGETFGLIPPFEPYIPGT